MSHPCDASCKPAHGRYLHVWSLLSQTVCAVLGVALGLQAAYMPYEHGYMNWLEFLSLISSTVTIYFSLYFTYSVTPSALVVVTVVVTLVNVLTIAVFMIALIRANWHWALELVGLNPRVRSAQLVRRRWWCLDARYRMLQHPCRCRVVMVCVA